MAPTLRLFHSPENVMLQANKLLSEGDAREAVKLYTEILYKLSPGHVPALLNRSLAYLYLRHPDLAAYDAYRAGILSNQFRSDSDSNLTKYQATTKYLRSEALAVDGGEEWTSDRNRFLLGGWGYSALSSLVINDVPQYEEPDVQSPRFPVNKRLSVCLALQIRAIYRLAGALYLCGGGARSDALGLIDDAYRRCIGMEDWEKTYFQILGNQILESCLKPWDEVPRESTGVRYSSQTRRRQRDEEKRLIKESMLAKTTTLKHQAYPWDIHDPDLEDPEWQKLLQSWIQQTTTNCTPYLIHDSPTPYIELRANRDIHNNELLLSERTKSNVTTSEPSEILCSPSTTPQRHFHCDTCGTLLLIPHDATLHYKTPAAPSNHASTTSRSRSRSPSSPSSIHSSPSSSPRLPPDTPSPSRPSTPPPPFTLCAPTHPVPTCSPTCRTLRTPYDTAPLHSTTLEHNLRTSHLLPSAIPIPLADRKRNCLIDLLFLRVFVNALATGMHPLQDRDLVFACCGKDQNQNSTTNNTNNIRNEDRHADHNTLTKPFSFTTNIIRPLWLLDRVFNALDLDVWDSLDLCEGWVLETLRARIDSAMEVSRYPRYVKEFDGEGELVRAFPYSNANGIGGGKVSDGSGNEYIVMDDEDVTMGEGNDEASGSGTDDNDNQDDQADQDAENKNKPKEEEISTASIHPIYNLIRIADPKKGEKANVTIQREEGVFCFAGVEGVVDGREGLGGEVAIRKGEVLLRER